MSFSQPSWWQKILPIAVLLLGIGVVVSSLRGIGVNTGYAPKQPLPFSHERHAGELQIPCQYCHSDVSKGPHASVPSMNTCMNCHSVVGDDKPAIEELRAAYAEGRSIEWVRVHDVPDHVYFSHWQHIERGVDCSTCHGDVANMDVVKQVESLQMGWCVECHRDNGAPTDCTACHK